MKEKRLCLQVEERYLRKIKKTIFLDWVCIFLIIMSGPVRVLFNVIPGYSCNIIIFLLYTSALFIWISQVKRRLLQNEECKFLSGVAALMLFLMAVRTIKFDFYQVEVYMHDMPGIYIMFRRHLRYYGCFLQFYILENRIIIN